MPGNYLLLKPQMAFNVPADSISNAKREAKAIFEHRYDGVYFVRAVNVAVDEEHHNPKCPPLQLHLIAAKAHHRPQAVGLAAR